MFSIPPFLSSTEVANEEGRKEMFYLTTHLTHFKIYSYMASGIW